MTPLTDLILVSAYCWNIPSFGDCDPFAYSQQQSLIPGDPVDPLAVIFVPGSDFARFSALVFIPCRDLMFPGIGCPHQIGFSPVGLAFSFEM